jgi:hypothetical protein
LDLSQSIASFSSIIQNFKEYLQKELENDEGFYREAVSTISTKVSSLSEAHRKEKKLASTYWMKQVNACWLKKN